MTPLVFGSVGCLSTPSAAAEPMKSSVQLVEQSPAGKAPSAANLPKIIGDQIDRASA
jgi:hypothetical protein